MAFTPKKQAFNASINAVTLGTGDKSIVIGGENVLPFYTFDAPIANSPKIAVEIRDTALEGETNPGMLKFYEGCETVVDMAKRAETMEGASAICLHFESADPNGENKSVEECVEIAKAVADAVTMPILVMGCKNIEKDAQLFNAISDALQGKNILVLSSREENYKNVGASAGLAYNQKVGAESAVDINLAKQLNVLLTQLGVPAASICMNLGSSAAGYGYEYLASTLDRVKAAALAQNDAMLQMPIVTPVSPETWGTKEAVLPEAEAPEWGPSEERGIEVAMVPCTEPYVDSTALQGAMVAISTASEHPVESFKFLNLLNTDPTLMTLLNYGVEGVHYTLDEDGLVVWTAKHDDYKPWTNGMGNVTLLPNTKAEGKGFREAFRDYYANAKSFPALGYIFDNTEVANEMAALSNVAAQYALALDAGFVGGIVIGQT